MTNTTVTAPDFSQWAYSIVIRLDMTVRTQDVVAEALAAAYAQGYALGTREGYEAGLTTGWVDEMERGNRA